MRTIATLFIVTMITLPMIFSVRISADKFTEIQNEIREFCNSITVEQKEADERFAREKLWCEREIKKAEDLVAKRKKEVAALEAQVKALEDKIADNKKAIKQYSDKIAENNKNMAEYKTQRCDANFNYITLRREHYDSQDMLKQLKKDLESKEKSLVEDYNRVLEQSQKGILTRVEEESKAKEFQDRQAALEKSNMQAQQDLAKRENDLIEPKLFVGIIFSLFSLFT